MLSFMRKHATSWIIKIILGSIVLVFVFWGMGNFAGKNKDWVATVNGERITHAQFNHAYKNLRDFYQDRFKDKFGEMEKSLDLKGKAVDQLVEARVWTQAAAALGFSVTDEELRAEISALPVFSATGGFSEERYLGILRSLGYIRAEFEQSTRETLMRRKLQDFVGAASDTADAEVLARFEADGRKIAVDYVAFEPSRYTPAAATEKEARAYFDAHEDDYKTEPVMKVAYLAFRPEDYAAKVDIPQEDLKSYYDEKGSEFDVPKTVSARHILIKVDEKAPKEVDEAARQKALEIEKRAKAGEDFAQLASMYSDDPSKARGGDLGTFEYKTMVKPFADKAFSMKPGEISEPVRTQFGWHIIQVEKVNEGRKLSFAEAEGRIRAKLAFDDADDLAFKAAQDAEGVTLGYKTLGEAAGKLGMALLSTDYFTARGPAGMPNGAEFAKAAFELEKGEISDTIQLPGAYYIVQVLDKKKASIPPFEAVKDRVMADLAQQKARDMAKSVAEKFVTALSAGKPFTPLAAEYGVSVRKSVFFGRNEDVAGLPPDRGLVREAFLLSKAAPYSKKPVPGKAGFYVFTLRDERLPDPKGLPGRRDELTATIIKQKKARVLDAYSKGLKEKAVVEYAPDYTPETPGSDQDS